MSILCHQKNLFFFLCIYKILQISKEKYKKCEVEIIDKGRYFWVNRNDLEVESDIGNWAQIFDKCDPKEQKCRHELMSNTKFQQYRVFLQKFSRKKKLKAVEIIKKIFRI